MITQNFNPNIMHVNMFNASSVFHQQYKDAFFRRKMFVVLKNGVTMGHNIKRINHFAMLT